MTKEFWRAAWTRALRTVAQVLGASLPVDIPITVTMVKGLDINVLWAILAWLGTGLLSGLASILTSIATGLPEVATSSVNKQTDKPPDEESCPVTVKAYDDYYENGSPKVKDGVILPEAIDEDGEENDPD